MEILTGEARRRKEVAGIPTDTGDADIEQFLDGNRQLTGSGYGHRLTKIIYVSGLGNTSEPQR